MVDSAGLFVLFLFYKGYFEPCFFHHPHPSDCTCSSWVGKRSGWPMGLCKWVSSTYNWGVSSSRRRWVPPSRAALGGFLIPWKGNGSISKYQRAWRNPHSKVVSPLMRKNGTMLAPLRVFSVYKDSQDGDTPSPLYWFKDTEDIKNVESCFLFFHSVIMTIHHLDKDLVAGWITKCWGPTEYARNHATTWGLEREQNSPDPGPQEALTVNVIALSMSQSQLSHIETDFYCKKKKRLWNFKTNTLKLCKYKHSNT